MKCCICGTVRNCAPYLSKIFNTIEKIGTLFEDYVVILYYDKSFDNTLQLITEYMQTNSKVKLYINSQQLSPYRTHRIAKGRNKCIQIIRNNFKDYEYFIMMDMDDICSKNIKLNVLVDALNMDVSMWDSLSFNHPDGYYDLWALSKRPFIFSCHHFAKSGDLWQTYIENVIKECPPGSLIPCYSAFNGFAIYRTQKFLNCSYNGQFKYNYISPKLLLENIAVAGNMKVNRQYEDCEHRSFHFQAIRENGAQIRISPLCLFG